MAGWDYLPSTSLNNAIFWEYPRFGAARILLGGGKRVTTAVAKVSCTVSNAGLSEIQQTNTAGVGFLKHNLE